MTEPHPIIQQMALYTLVLFTGIVLHELLHYVAAFTLRKRPQLALTLRGPTVKMPDYEAYEEYGDLTDRRLKLDYAIISLAPYTLLPLYLHLAQTTPEPGAKLAFITLASIHFASLLTEFKQSTQASIIAGIIALATLYLLAP